jgi:hypothetical protein
VNVITQDAPAENVPEQPVDDVATVYPVAVVVAVTTYWSFKRRTAELVPLPVTIFVAGATARSMTVTVEVAPFCRPLTAMASVLVVEPPLQFTVQTAGTTVIVDEAVLLAGFGSVEDEDSPTVAVFVIVIPAEAVTVAAISSVAIVPEAISPTFQIPVPDA